MFPLRYEHHIHIKEWSYPRNRAWRRLSVFSVRYEYHLHKKVKLSLEAHGIVRFLGCHISHPWPHSWQWGCHHYAPVATPPPQTRAIVWLKVLRKLTKKCNYIAKRTLNLPACSIVLRFRAALSLPVIELAFSGRPARSLATIPRDRALPYPSNKSKENK
jgi:hypothetical protein